MACKRPRPDAGGDRLRLWPASPEARIHGPESGPRSHSGPGEVSEWLKEHAWKVCKRLNRASGVRIPLSPPVSSQPATGWVDDEPRSGAVSFLWWPRRPLATLGRKSRQGRKAATVSIDAGAEASRRGHRLFGHECFFRACRCDGIILRGADLPRGAASRRGHRLFGHRCARDSVDDAQRVGFAPGHPVVDDLPTLRVDHGDTVAAADGHVGARTVCGHHDADR